MSYNVDVVENRYRLRGEFHSIEANQPIRNEAGRLCGVTNPRRLVHTHSYGGEYEFFSGIAEGRLIGTRCDNADCEVGYESVFMPFRIYCPDCLQRTTSVDLTEVANRTSVIHSFMITERTGAFNTLEKPIKFINVEFEGVCTILMGYLLRGEPAIGDRVVPIFATEQPTYTILDLAWVPEGTAQSDLPKGFSFGK
jgi:uncharacterized OB-fold protein